MSNELRERLGKLSTEASKIERELGGDYLLTDESEGNIHHHLGVIQEAIGLAISCIEKAPITLEDDDEKINIRVVYAPYQTQVGTITTSFDAYESTKNLDLANWIRETAKRYPDLRVKELEERPSYEGEY